jgi:hypothetical protein
MIKDDIITQAAIQSIPKDLVNEVPMTPLSDEESESLRKWLATQPFIDGHPDWVPGVIKQ